MPIVQNTNLVIDTFHTELLKASGVELVHVLTHFHSDHRAGLTKSFRGRIFCSEITGELLTTTVGVNRHFIEVLELGRELVVYPPSELEMPSFSITFVDANHCPGSVSVVIKGSDFTYFYMGDSRVTESVIAGINQIHPSPFDIAWVDSTFYDNNALWDAMPSVPDSIAALRKFMSNCSGGIALEFELLGTEILIESVLDQFPYERMLVISEQRYNELEVLYSNNTRILSRLVPHPSGFAMDFRNRFLLIPRSMRTPSGYTRVRATTQRWAHRIRTNDSGMPFQIVEHDETKHICFIFFSMHSCKREIDHLISELRVRETRILFPPIQVFDRNESESEVQPETSILTEKPRSVRCRRRPFEYSMDSMWLDAMVDSQETLIPSQGWNDDITLPTWCLK